MFKKLLLSCCLLSYCAPAHAQSSCGVYETVTEKLKSRYSETLIFQGYYDPFIHQVWGNYETGTYTIISVKAKIEKDEITGEEKVVKIACLLSSGVGYEVFKPKPEGNLL